MLKVIFMPWTILVDVGRHALTCFEALLDKGGMKSLILSMAGLILFWHIYTPIHELLHVAACVAGGGTVEELALKPQYGGTLLQHFFPFITPESDYAGQLTGFQTPNYLAYAFVDFAPYILSLFGVTLFEYCRRKQRAMLFGLAMVLAFVPFMSIPGDYYEAVSLVTTQIAEASNPGLASGALISDDLFKSVGELSKNGQLNGGLIFLVILGALAAIYLAMMTLAFQVLIARRVYGKAVLAVERSPSLMEKTSLKGEDLLAGDL